MKIGRFEIPPKTQELKDKEINQNIIKKLYKFDTDGWDEYPKEEFIKYVQENDIDVSTTLDFYLNELDPNNKFSTEEIKYMGAFRAWLHCDFENAKKYVLNKFNFECKNNLDFINKYKYFNTVVSFLFEKKRQTETETEIPQKEKFIFNSLRNEAEKNKGSFILNYLSADYLSVYNDEKFSVQEEKDWDFVPYEISPGIYAFDAKNSVFALFSKNNLTHDSLYVSQKKDYDKISSIIKSLGKEKLIGQDEFDNLAKYFSILTPDKLMLYDKGDIDETEMYLFRELNSKLHPEPSSRTLKVI